MNPAEIVVEVLRRLRYHFEMFQGQDRFLCSCLVRIEFSERNGRLERVFDLSTVPGRLAFLMQIFVLSASIVVNVFRFDLKCSITLGKALEVHFPNLKCRAFI